MNTRALLLLPIVAFLGCEGKQATNVTSNPSANMKSMDGPGAFILDRKLRYKNGTWDVIEQYIFHPTLAEGFHVQVQGAGLNGDMRFSDSAINSGMGAIAMSQGSVFSSSSRFIDVESTQINDDSPPFLISRKLFSELRDSGKTTIQYGDPVEISVQEHLEEDILVDGASRTVPVYRCIGELEFVGKSGFLEFVIIDDAMWPILLRIECGQKDSDFRLFTRFEEAGKGLKLASDND